jgi:nucleotide-binding universal stress UspA family protein
MIKRILVALSGTRFTDAAIEHALGLAREHGVELCGVTDIDVGRVESMGPVPIGAGAAAKGLIEHRRRLAEGRVEEVIQRFEIACAEAHVPCAVHREAGEPFARLMDLWRYCDLTIVGLQGLFEYELIHNPDDVLLQLIATGVRPILAVAVEHRPIRRVLVAYSGTPESAKTMKRFVQMRLWPDMEIKITCLELPEQEARALLADAADYCALHGYQAETEYVAAPPKEALLGCASQWEADLIVMGATARARLLRHLLGDTLLHVVRHAGIPLYLAQ